MASCPELFEISSADRQMAVGNVNLIDLELRLSSHGSPAAEASSTTSPSCNAATLRHTFEKSVVFPFLHLPSSTG